MKAQIFLTVMLISSSLSIAGEIKLISETWDFICEVEVATGLGAPESPDETFEISAVNTDSFYKDGIIFTGADRLCYRRSSSVEDCYSPMNERSCYTNMTEVVDLLNIF